jgi:hypothetical protein
MKNTLFAPKGASHAAACSFLSRRRRIFPGTSRSVLFVIGLFFLLSVSLGCRKKTTVPTPPPIQTEAKIPPESAPQAVTPSVIPSSKPTPMEPAPAPKTIVVPSSFDVGVTNFKAGNYEKAARSFDDYLRNNANSENRDVALFHLGLSRAVSGNSGRNTRRAEDALKRLITEFPNSPYKGPAEFILGLQAQIESLKLDAKEKETKIKQLSDELQKLKDIDMQRRPSRPPY